MSSSSRPASPSAQQHPISEPAAQAPLAHEASHAPSTSASAPPTKVLSQDTSLTNGHSEDRPAAGDKMAKLGLKAAPPELDPADLDVVIDISRPVDDSYYADPDSTLRNSVDAHRTGLRKDADADSDSDSDSTGEDEEEDADWDGPTEADITTAQRQTDTPTPSAEHEHGGSTLYGSGAGSDPEREREREHVQEHPLRLDVHPPSPPPWDMQDEAERGRISPQRFEFSTAKSRTVHEFTSKPRNHNRPLIPHSAYYFGPPPPDAAYGTEPTGQIGVHHPREIVRIERDYSGGELPQFLSTYPLELEGRITPTQFLETINAINEILLSAHSLGHAFVDNALAFFSLQTSRVLKKSHYEKEMDRLKSMIDMLNEQVYNPVGLNIKWPRSVAFLFLEIEYY
ncbi:Golgin subfamily A member 7/ERF4 family-domain-containing protein [Cubamyces menziesii]|nr:Golgin subfamily A member 7/ERF4 family-domain-containing protein [Cubamyces menziesii]